MPKQDTKKEKKTKLSEGKLKPEEPKEKEPKEKYFLEIMVGEPPKVYEFNTDNVVETLLHSGIDPISIDFWTTIQLTNRKTKKTARELLNVPRMRNCLTIDQTAIFIAGNLTTLTD